jgi:alkylation response protein AidB-like acyl-CoA dehydrogenase
VDFHLADQQRPLIEQIRELGRKKFAPRAAVYDRESSFPFENYADLHEHGLLALCVPTRYGGMGADFQTYCLVAAEMGRYCSSTALTYNMHTCTTLWIGDLSDDIPMTGSQRVQHVENRREHFRRIVEEGAIYAQHNLEGGPGVSVGMPYETSAQKVDSGWVITGKKVFASLAGAADYYGVLCTKIKENVDVRDTLYLAVPRDAAGVEVVGDWDFIGMRGTVSHTIVLKEVFVPSSAQLLPPGTYFELANRWPHMFLTLAPTYVGIAQAAYDFTVKYLRGEVDDAPAVKLRTSPAKQMIVAEMFIKLEQMLHLFFRAVSDARANPSHQERLRAYAANYTVMENANEICRLALRACGGRALSKALPLERLYRDSCCGVHMRPWTVDRCIERLGQGTLYEPGETDN